MASSSSKISDSSSHRDGPKGLGVDASGLSALHGKLKQLKCQAELVRLASIKDMMEANRRALQRHTCGLFDVAAAAEASSRGTEGGNVLSQRSAEGHSRIVGWNLASGSGEREVVHVQEENQSAVGTLALSSSGGSAVQRIVVRLVNLPLVDKIPSYTTWTFLDKNQRMADDQSIVGRRRIYYDSVGNEALICSESDEEIPEPGEEKHVFTGEEDQLIWKVTQEHGSSQEVLSAICQFVTASPSEIEDRSKFLCVKNDKYSGFSEKTESHLDKTVDMVLDSFDNLFCRRCLVFDCRLHGCSQNLVFPSEKQPCGFELDENKTPCSDQCYLQIGDTRPDFKKSGGNQLDDPKSKTSNKNSGGGSPTSTTEDAAMESSNKESAAKNLLSSSREDTLSCWSTLERGLYLKGVEIFGKNSCQIARNTLAGLKTCMEVASYMYNNGAAMAKRHLLGKSISGDFAAEQDYMEQEVVPRTRICRRRGRIRKNKYTSKSSGHPAVRKRIGDGKKWETQYTPCGCQQMCTKGCPCMDNVTCCEKYCGCSKSCKNRFRGCHCAKSQCRSRQCPCFAASRECDPDVCRNCWVSCGDGSLGEPPARGDGYQCENMKLLLKQQQRILLGRSDVAGWGAFTKNPVQKNDYLGEYTGELISHKEADKRGKIYDRANSSFLFDLNDQYVLDANRKGDKLKFANHSYNPNCFAKVMMVAGDHRVGIYAGERIEASEELFYDYRYGPDQTPHWAKRPEGSKKEEPSGSHRRAHKVAR
ncbi:histone-lysine N-methyltransferase EZ3 [Brachypodium distachyon]|uniref:Uncharacterized protein n=1 Tax=Brachypodium distachyon TaxID=15368 RepID=I1H677_BRADI|nr:histone-lysine N-methyltransferase EZ3 [Brachypodium distachyon]KQK22000.1 hypothetical protein BRADI_1g64460v3 [Brachypodium distachyon]|eukprot:XP_010228709.1 histone-lysine N-methyltransferase EZ3 [Brachypodium distachyon]